MKLFKSWRSKTKGHRPDYVFLGALFVLVIFGIIMLSSASSDLGKLRFNDTFYYLKHQICLGLGLGTIGFVIGYFLNYKIWGKIALPLLLIGLILLLMVFTPVGFYHFGASRWLKLGPILLQPAEIMKFAFIVYLASWLNSKRGKSVRQTSFIEGYLPFICLCGIVALLIVFQPATTTVVILMLAGLAEYFVSGARLSFVAGTIIAGILGITVLVAVTPYRMERITTYISHIRDSGEVNPEKEGYHLNQALIAIGNGGLTGIGFGESTAKYKSLPEPIGDSIFAVIAEELGFLGAIGVILTYVIIFAKGFAIAFRSRDQFAKLLVVGFVSIFAIQAFINIAAISGILPLTGVPLPFVSYGGTSLAIFLTMGGIIANISKFS